MLYGKYSQQNSKYLNPIFGSQNECQDLPKYKLNDIPVEPRIAYRMVHDELEDEGNARQNLATFCQTYMEPEATLLMTETLDKNAIDKSEYPRTTELENRCVNMIAHLWHAGDDYLGTSTVGSSEGCMLGGLTLKVRWEQEAKKRGFDYRKHRPNLIIAAGYQVCWEKFCTYWDVELRQVPLQEGKLNLDIDKAMSMVDEYTIGIIGILGITYTGQYDDIEELDNRVTEYNQTHAHQLYIHVDAASGGFYAPFMEPDLKWDFRLNNVVSINVSGHKYGLVYPGVGWIVWRDRKDVPENLIFNVSYLGGSLPTMAINFSRSASQIVGQYYNFVRYGWKGYKEIHEKTHQVAIYLAKEISKLPYFEMVNAGEHLPILCYRLKETQRPKWSLYDLSDRLRMRGWQVPTYPMPENIQHMIVQRIVCRADFGMNVAIEFIEDFKACVHELDHAHVIDNVVDQKGNYGFTH